MNLIGGGILLALGLFMLLGFFRAAPSLDGAVAFLTLLLAVGIPAGAGVALIRSHYRKRQSSTEYREQLRLETHQAELVKLAHQLGGRITVVEAVAETGMDSQTVETALRGLVTQGVADVQVTDSGLLVYVFEDVQRLPEKGSSRDILDD